MERKLLISTAYLPPAEYFAAISKAEEILIEAEENYLKQTYRNRCYILSAHGPQMLSIPVYLGSLHKTMIRDIRIDYSKRWQQIHLGAMIAAYRSSPFFDFYFESIEKAILLNQNFLIDLNLSLFEKIVQHLSIEGKSFFTKAFEPDNNLHYDYRYRLSPKKKSHYIQKPYIQVFDNGNGFIPNLSIIDLLFNVGPDASRYL